MAVLAQKNKQQYKIGETVEFVGYEGDTEGELQVGDILKVTGYDPDQEVYNVEREEDGFEDSLFDVEFAVPQSKKKEESKPAAKRGRPAKAKVEEEDLEDEDEEEEEEEEEDEDDEEEEVVAKKSPTKTKQAKKQPVVEDEPEDENEELEEEDEEQEDDEDVAQEKKKRGRPKKTEESKKTDKPEKKTDKKASKSQVEEEDEQEEAEEKSKSKQAKKPAKEETELAEFVATKSVEAALEEYGDDLSAAMALAEQKEKTVFTLGGVLARIKRNDTFSEIVTKKGDPVYEEGLKGFNAYVKDHLGIEPRSAAYYVDLYEMFSQVTTEDKISKIGWTKLRELLPLRDIIDEKNVDSWLKKAKSNSTKELHDEVTKHLVDAGEKIHGNKSLAEQTTFKFVVYNDQATVVSEAIELAKSVIGEDASDGAALNLIVSEWLDSMNNSK